MARALIKALAWSMSTIMVCLHPLHMMDTPRSAAPGGTRTPRIFRPHTGHMIAVLTISSLYTFSQDVKLFLLSDLQE